MMLFRRAYAHDLDKIHQLALDSGIGITTLPHDKELLAKRLAWSCASFDKQVVKPEQEYYLFVLQDPANGQLIGTAAIDAAIGHDAPFYSYYINNRTRLCTSLNKRIDQQTLNLVNAFHGKSELCTLFLKPEFRRNNNGLLLSKGRFLFMADNPHRFAPTVIAEIRGVADEQGNSPFWDKVGKHFFQLSFAEADRLTLATDKQFIADLMPADPIYINLLPAEAQAVIGKPHPSSNAAMKILLQEGFANHGYVDIFDAGPTLEAPREQLLSIAASQLLTVNNIDNVESSPRYLIGNANLDFHAAIAKVIINESKATCTINQETADLLQVKKGCMLRVVPLTVDKENPNGKT